MKGSFAKIAEKKIQNLKAAAEIIAKNAYIHFMWMIKIQETEKVNVMD